MPCTFALQSVSRSEFACTEWPFVPRQSRAAMRLLANYVPISQAVELFSQAVVLGLERFDALMQRRDQNLDFINRVFRHDVL
jgi:hypothetical protein